MRRLALALAVLVSVSRPLGAEILLDQNPVEVSSAFLFRDHANELAFYYIPRAPRVATWPDGKPKFTLIQYKKVGKDISGGLAHFLVTFGLTDEEKAAAERDLRKTVPEGRVLGPVPFVQGEFTLISASAGAGGLFSRKIVGTGKAPLLAGQEAAVSLALTEEGSTLLIESFKQPTSDVSVQFLLTYEGLSPAFRARLTVHWDKVFKHRGLQGRIGGLFLSAEISKVYDELREQGAIELEVIGEDQSMEALLTTAYSTLAQMMFEAKPVKPEDLGKVRGGTGGSFLSKIFGGAGVGYHLKKVQWTGDYVVDLTRRKRDQRTLPITGNIGDIYRRFRGDASIFRVVDLSDPAFEERTIQVVLDGEDYETFKDYVNFASVTFRRKNRAGDFAYHDILFDREKLAAQGNRLPYTYGRVGDRTAGWIEYEHRAQWSFRGGVEVASEFAKSSAPVLTLTPPYRYRRLEVLANEKNMREHDVIRIAVRFRHKYRGKTMSDEIVLRDGDPLNAFYRYVAMPDDLGYEYQTTFLLRNGEKVERPWQKGTDSFVYAYLAPPASLD